MRSSSRGGRFKKKLVSEEILQSEAPVITAKLAPFLELRAQGKFSDAEFTALYLILYLSTRFPYQWFGARQSSSIAQEHHLPLTLGEMQDLGVQFAESVTKKLSPTMSLGELFNNYAFKSTPRSVNRAIVEWSTGNYSLELMNRIPTPLEVLNQQRQSKRCVTALLKETQLSRYVLGDRDPMSFTMHDLIHADHFFFDNNCYQGQMGVYRALWSASTTGLFDDLLSHEDFKNEFEYVIADMNAYCVHLMKCLKSAMIHHHPETGHVVFEKMLSSWPLDPKTKNAFETLNTDAFRSTEDSLLIQAFFDSYTL